MSEKLVNFRMDEDEYVKFKLLAMKERKTVKDLTSTLIKDYLKEHGDGNPQYTIEQFQDPDFMACPAFYRDGLAWENYIKQATPEEKEKLKAQILLIEKRLLKWF